MAKTETAASGPARGRVGLPILRDGSREQPLLLALPEGDGRAGQCNNGCDPCVSARVPGPESAFDVPVRGLHVVLRDRELTLRGDLAKHVAELSRRGARSISLLTNGRALLYPERARRLVSAGVHRFVIKLFGRDAASHDRHTRVPGSFDQAMAGVAQARALDRRAVITFPTLLEGDAAAERAARIAFAREHTGWDPVELPEPQVTAYGGEYRYDLVLLRQGVADPRWQQSFLPMIHVNTGPACNARCVYCNVHGGDDQRLFDESYVDQVLSRTYEWARASLGDARPTLDFIGGEPTLHPGLPRLVARARAIGFASVLICTNGALLLRPGYLDQLAAAGLTGVRFSFHDHRRDVAAALADAGGVGNKYLEVAELLLSRTDLRPHFYRILLRQNLEALPDYVRWIGEHNRTGKRLEVMLGMPSQRGRMQAAQDLYPSLERLRPVVAEAIEVGRRFDLDVLVHHAPACLVPDDPSRAMCLHVEALQVEALSNEQRGFNTEGDTRHAEACASCPARDAGCYGLPEAYFTLDAAAAERWATPIVWAPLGGALR